VSAKPFVAAAVQAASVFLDRDATVEKACALIAEAAAQGATLIVLPETFVPAYPAWVWFLPLTRRADIAMLYRELVENSVDVPGPVTERIGRAAREAKAWVSIGINERNAGRSGTTLYNTLLLFDDAGRLVERHRKLMPTGGERMVWTPGEPVPLVVHDTPHGRIGSLICWENYMPLARFALYEQGAQIHLAPTWDKSEQWIASMRHIAREGRVFVIGCCQAIHRDQVPDRFAFKDTLPAGLEWINIGNSVIVDPEGAFLAGPVAEKERILCAEIDPGRACGSRWIFDAAGHYHRPDLFAFSQRSAEAPAPAAAAPGRGAARRSAARQRTTPKVVRRADMRRR
jgi:nitrilase